MIKIIEKQRFSKLDKRSRSVITMMKITKKYIRKKVATRIMGRYWDDKSYNEKILFSARLYRRTHKGKVKNYIQKYKKMAKMQADLRKLRKNLRMFNKDHEKYSKLQIKILFERTDAVEKSARNAPAKLHSNIQKKCCQFNEKLPMYGLATVEQFIDVTIKNEL